METEYFPLCCTARVLCDFGQDDNSEGVEGEYHSKDNLVDRINAAIEQRKEEGLGCLTAMTTSTQETANIVLQELGFQSSEWMDKPEHPETQLKLWWLPLHPKSKEEG